jgi:uridine phosphorylase
MARQYHVALDDGDVAPIVLLPGDSGRMAELDGSSSV